MKISYDLQAEIQADEIRQLDQYCRDQSDAC